VVYSSIVVHTLLVEDNDQFRGCVRSLLANSKLLIIGEASDGLQAIEKAKDLQPDLILLDVGLPKLNGIQAAVQIQQVSPKSKNPVFKRKPISVHRRRIFAHRCIRLPD
jgi:two-component system, chemotaxis family, chemotaxis protein CheY